AGVGVARVAAGAGGDGGGAVAAARGADGGGELALPVLGAAPGRALRPDPARTGPGAAARVVARAAVAALAARVRARRRRRADARRRRQHTGVARGGARRVAADAVRAVPALALDADRAWIPELPGLEHLRRRLLLSAGDQHGPIAERGGRV